MTAFFDDLEEPLVLRTPLSNDEFTRDLLQVLSEPSFDIHIFDEHDRELLGFRANNRNFAHLRSLLNTAQFPTVTVDLACQFDDQLRTWFGDRSPTDDASACTITLHEELFPPNPILWRPNPGDLSEQDIAGVMQRPFSRDHVYLNPTRADNAREFVDVLVATDKTLLLVQAKDSPNTEAALTRTIHRKQATAVQHIKKASAQLRGSIRHLQSADLIEIVASGERLKLSALDREVFGLVIVRELFDPERPVYSSLFFGVLDDTDIPCLLLDYAELLELAFFRPSEDGFVDALWRVFTVACEQGVFPRSRAWPQASPSLPQLTIGTGHLLQDQETREPSRTDSRGGSVPDRLVVIDRADVDAHDVSSTATVLSRVLANRETIEQFRGRVELVFEGYSDDPREPYEIPEVRRFCAKLDETFPFWFYFLSTDGMALGMIACCLCSVTKIRPGVVSFGPDLLKFMVRHFRAMNWLFDNFSLDEEHNVEISAEVTEYFRSI
ncbi:chlororespiratory reduction 6 domain-containing protein [Candidatus Palauibacter sp.]|uniref:chlororespiratory reduction 6 domain-containing protein n=1 Tax=Candidatus Palauibacter sp. TaxID=3101350 RepID=UPI003B0116D8